MRVQLLVRKFNNCKGLGIQNRGIQCKGWASLATQLNSPYSIMNYTCLQVKDLD